MNTDSVKEMVKDLIVDNSATLLTGLTKQGEARIIHEISKSNLTPLPGYYYIIVRIPIAREFSNTNTASTLRKPTRWAEYECELHVVDEALVQDTDDAAYEQLHADMDKFTDRIIKLIKDQNCIGDCMEIKRSPGENDRAFQKLDLSGTVLDTERSGWASLYYQIHFTLVDKCVDDTALYS